MKKSLSLLKIHPQGPLVLLIYSHLYSVLAFAISMFMILVIFVSALQYILSSDPSIM